MNKVIHWLGHAAVKITGEVIIYVDPYEISGGEKADIILITHDHYDHLSKDDLDKIVGDDTVIVIPASCRNRLDDPVKTISPGESLTVKGVTIQAVPAYNIGKAFHPKENAYVGYVFSTGGVSYYHAGDSDYIPEMKTVKADVAFLPVGGTYTMNAEEAAQAAADIKPDLAIPIHWGSIVGSRAEAEKFRDLCFCQVNILEPES